MLIYPFIFKSADKIKEFSQYRLKRILAVFYLTDLKEKIKGKIKEFSEYHPWASSMIKVYDFNNLFKLYNHVIKPFISPNFKDC